MPLLSVWRSHPAFERGLRRSLKSCLLRYSLVTAVEKGKKKSNFPILTISADSQYQGLQLLLIVSLYSLLFSKRFTNVISKYFSKIPTVQLSNTNTLVSCTVNSEIIGEQLELRTVGVA